MQKAIYRAISSMEPLLPSARRNEMAELTVSIYRAAGRIESALPSRIVRQAIANLVTRMNSYYSNLIEGHRTLPQAIEAAEEGKMEADPQKRRNQLLGKSLVDVERSTRKNISNRPDTDIYSSEFLQSLHHEFYDGLPEEERIAYDLSGKAYSILPGEFRNFMVDVGKHTPPDHSCIAAFLNRFHKFYGSDKILETNRLVAIAAAHHRLLWIHPFGDGNGRVARLFTQAGLMVQRIDSNGLWSLSRGLARNRETYYAMLQDADAPRLNDLDGRGNLTDKGLSKFCIFFLETILDQIEFMEGLIQPHTLLERIKRYVEVVPEGLNSKTRERLNRVLSELFYKGSIERGQVGALANVSVAPSAELTKKLLELSLAKSAGPKKDLEFAIPSDAQIAWFPQLFTDSAT